MRHYQGKSEGQLGLLDFPVTQTEIPVLLKEAKG
jgi:hypothetical protein